MLINQEISDRFFIKTFGLSMKIVDTQNYWVDENGNPLFVEDTELLTKKDSEELKMNLSE